MNENQLVDDHFTTSNYMLHVSVLYALHHLSRSSRSIQPSSPIGVQGEKTGVLASRRDRWCGNGGNSSPDDPRPTSTITTQAAISHATDEPIPVLGDYPTDSSGVAIETSATESIAVAPEPSASTMRATAAKFRDHHNHHDDSNHHDDNNNHPHPTPPQPAHRCLQNGCSRIQYRSRFNTNKPRTNSDRRQDGVFC